MTLISHLTFINIDLSESGPAALPALSLQRPLLNTNLFVLTKIMPRRKPASGKQHKAELQLKRAIKRGDAPADAAATRDTSSRGRSRAGRGGARRGGQPPEVAARVQAARRLQSAFVKLSPEFLEEAKHRASELALIRPISFNRSLFPEVDIPEGQPKLSVIKRPKWNYEMSKKQVEANEEGFVKKWLEQTDAAIESWRQRECEPASDPASHVNENDSKALAQPGEDSQSEMPTSAPLYERNIEVWRQL